MQADSRLKQREFAAQYSRVLYRLRQLEKYARQPVLAAVRKFEAVTVRYEYIILYGIARGRVEQVVILLCLLAIVHVDGGIYEHHIFVSVAERVLAVEGIFACADGGKLPEIISLRGRIEHCVNVNFIVVGVQYHTVRLAEISVVMSCQFFDFRCLHGFVTSVDGFIRAFRLATGDCRFKTAPSAPHRAVLIAFIIPRLSRSGNLIGDIRAATNCLRS